MSVPLILQGEANECGLACLCMLLQSHGRRIALRDLRTDDADGQRLTLDYLSKLAKQHRLTARALRCEPGDLSNIVIPAMVHLDFEHYAVVTRITRRYITLNDPARGIVKLSWSSFGKRFTGVVLECQPGQDFERSDHMDPGAIRRIASRLDIGPVVPGLVGLLALSLIVHGLTLITPYYLQLVVDQVLLLSNLDLMTVLTLGFLLVYLVASITRFLRGLLILRIGSHLSFGLAAGFMDKLLTLPLPFFARRHIGDFTSRFASLQPVQDFVSQGLVGLLMDSLMMIMTMTVLFLLAPVVASSIIGLTLVFLVLQLAMLSPFRRYTHEQVIADANLQSHFVENVQAIETIRRNDMQTQRTGRWLNLLIDTINPQVRAGQWSIGIDTLRYLFSGVLTLIVVHLSAKPISAGDMSIGTLYTLVAYAGHFAAAAVNCSLQWQGLAMLSLHAQRLSDITENPSDKRRPLELYEPVTKLELSHLSFSYPSRGNVPLIEDISLTLNAGECLAVTGASGSGKSTLIALLLGDLAPTSGEISLNGRPLTSDVDPSGYLSVLHQHDHLLAGSVADNITLMSDSLDQERMIAAARTAEIHEDILRLPMSYQEQVSARTGISHGQRQRLMIARALYCDSDILILDEATCHLDREIERRVMDRILCMNRLCIYVTHDHSIASLADHWLHLPMEKNGQTTAPIPSPGLQ